MADYQEISSKFSNNRTQLPAIFITTPKDKFTSMWTRDKPSKQVSWFGLLFRFILTFILHLVYWKGISSKCWCPLKTSMSVRPKFTQKRTENWVPFVTELRNTEVNARSKLPVDKTSCSLYREVFTLAELNNIYLLLHGRHVCASVRSINMASPYKAL